MSQRFENEDNKRLISEDEARRLLARAVEIEAREGAYLSLEELREVALEAGIPADAIDRAIRELDAGALRPPTVGRSISERLVRLRPSAWVLAFFGAAAFTPGDIVTLTIMFALLICGLFEGTIALARLLGRYSPPSGPSKPEMMKKVTQPEPEPDRHRNQIGFSLALVLRGVVDGHRGRVARGVIP